jgi:hypothetical protein
MPAVKEPALVAVIGVGGVLVGAIGSGLVQAAGARFDRRRAGRAAARVLAMDLHEAEHAIGELRPLRDWDRIVTDWDHFEAAWQQHRDQLTHVLTTDEFGKVASAFAAMRTLSHAAKRDLAKPPPITGRPSHFDPSDDILANYFKLVQRAKWIVLLTSYRWREYREKRRVTRAIAASHNLVFPDA